MSFGRTAELHTRAGRGSPHAPRHGRCAGPRRVGRRPGARLHRDTGPAPARSCTGADRGRCVRHEGYCYSTTVALPPAAVSFSLAEPENECAETRSVTDPTS